MKPIGRASPYWLEHERKLEMVYFVRQYKSWAKKLACIDSIQTIPSDILERVQASGVPDPTYYAAEERERCRRRMKLVDDALTYTTEDPATRALIKEVAIDKDISYDKIAAYTDRVLPVGRTKFYELEARFYWILSNLRD